MIRKENIMKKIFLIPLMFLTFLSLTACSPTDDDLIVPETPEQPENPGNGNSDDNDPEEPTDPIPGGNGRYLVLFTSRSDNTERVANEIRDQLDCDILEVEPETAFETDYNAMLERARDELNAIQQGNFPAVKTCHSAGKFSCSQDFDGGFRQLRSRVCRLPYLVWFHGNNHAIFFA